MGTLLIDHWLGDAERIDVLDDASISMVREGVRVHGRTAGLDTAIIERMAAGASELARNQLAHAISGIVGVRTIGRGGVPGIEVIAADHGRGVEDPTVALAGMPRVEGSLGVGLSAALRQSDELDLDTRAGTGTCVRIRAFASPVARKSEVGVIARPHPDEHVIGDHAVVWRGAGGTTIAVADGLGHGVPARDAALAATAAVLAHPERSISALIGDAHAAAAGTRGAVMAIARIDDGRVFEYASVGNISLRAIGINGVVRPLASIAGTLGAGVPRRIATARGALQPGEVLAVTSDGIATRFDLTAEPAIVRAHPAVIAHAVMARFARGADDALVLIVR